MMTLMLLVVGVLGVVMTLLDGLAADIPGQPKKVSFFVKSDFVLCKDTYKLSKSSTSDF